MIEETVLANETVTEQPTTEVAPVEEAPQQPVEAQPEPVVEKVSTPRDTEQARNFKAIKEAAARAARERDEALQRLQEYERRATNNSEVTPKYAEAEDDLNIKDDELAEGKHLQRLNTTIKKLQAKQRDLEQQSYTNSAEVQLRSKFSDFDKVMTLENIQTFSAAYPELAKSINASQNLYDKAVSAYTLIKRFGIHDDEPAYSNERTKALENIAKPKPLASVSPQQGESPLSRANAFSQGLTEDLKKQLRKEMAEASKRY